MFGNKWEVQEMNPKDKRLKNWDKINDLEFASILVSLVKTKMPMWQQDQIVLTLYDKYYSNLNGDK